MKTRVVPVATVMLTAWVLGAGVHALGSDLKETYLRETRDQEREYRSRVMEARWEYERKLKERWGRLRQGSALESWVQDELCEAGVDFDRGVVVATCLGEDPDADRAMERGLVRVTEKMARTVAGMRLAGSRTLGDELRRKGVDPVPLVLDFVNAHVKLGEDDLEVSEAAPGLIRVKVTYRLPISGEGAPGGLLDGGQEGAVLGGSVMSVPGVLPQAADPGPAVGRPVAVEREVDALLRAAPQVVDQEVLAAPGTEPGAGAESFPGTPGSAEPERVLDASRAKGPEAAAVTPAAPEPLAPEPVHGQPAGAQDAGPTAEALTGVIFDVAGMKLWPSPVPVVMSDEGRVLYDIERVDPAVLERESGSDWKLAMEDALAGPRTGTRPLKVRPVRVSENNEIVVSREDAGRLERADREHGLLARGRVTVVVGEGKGPGGAKQAGAGEP